MATSGDFATAMDTRHAQPHERVSGQMENSDRRAAGAKGRRIANRTDHGSRCSRLVSDCPRKLTDG